MSSYLIVIEKGPKSYGAYCPDLPGCVAAAKTRMKAEKLIREAIAAYLEFMRERGEPIPPPSSAGSVVRVAA